MHTPGCRGGNFQPPGIPGTGNALDPAVRAAIRDYMQEILPDLIRQIVGEQLSQAMIGQNAPQAAPPPPAERAKPASSDSPYYFMTTAGTNFDPIVPQILQGEGRKPG